MAVGRPMPTPTYENGQEAIMTEQGYGVAAIGLEHMTEAEKMKFMTHEDLVLLLPLVSEANHISEELRKPVHFDVKIESKLKNGVFHAEVRQQPPPSSPARACVFVSHPHPPAGAGGDEAWREREPVALAEGEVR